MNTRMKRQPNLSPILSVGQGRVNRRHFVKHFGTAAAGLALGGAGLLLPRSAFAAGPAIERPISDFLDTQGTTSIFTPPLDVGDYGAWFSDVDVLPVHGGSLDYAGIANQWIEDQTGGLVSFGTTIKGNVTERPLNDGRAEVTVILQSQSALTWAVDLDPAGDLTEQLVNNPPVFGYRLQEIASDPENIAPALGDSEFKLVFKNTAPGADLPDVIVAFVLGEADPAIELVAIAFRVNCRGPLRAEFGVAEGTPGLCVITQTGLLTTGFHGAVADAFPAERVDVRATVG